MDALDTVTQRALWPSLPAPAEGPRYRIVYNPPGGPHALVGAIQLSRDRVGREYSLVVARPVDRQALDPGAAPSWPLRWAPVFDAAAAIVYNAVDRQAATADVTTWVGALPEATWAPGRSTAVDAHVRAATELPAQAFFERFPGGSAQARVVMHRFAGALRQPTLPGYGLRLALPPPADDFGRADAVSFWLAAGAHLMRARPPWPTLLWTDDGSPGQLFLFYTRFASTALRGIFVGATDPDTVLALDAPPDAATQRAADGRPLTRFLADPRASVADLLARLHSLV